MHVSLNFPGNAAEAFEFYRSLFGGELSSHVRFRDMPMEGVDIPEADQDKAMHIALPIGEDNVLMASDALESLGQQLQRGNNVYVSVPPRHRRGRRPHLQGALGRRRGREPIADQVWGDYYSACTDKFGIKWMVNHHSPETA